MRNRQIGKFYINADLIDDAALLVRLIMANVIVVRAEFRYDRNAIEYIAISDQFEPIGQASEPKLYQWHIDRDAVRPVATLVEG